MSERIVVMGAAGRDFHDYVAALRDDPDRRVVAFTRAPGQNFGETDAGGYEAFPAELTPDGRGSIPIVSEADLEDAIAEHDAGTVLFAYSDVAHEDVMHAASRALAAGADFGMLGPDSVQLDVDVPVVAVNAVRTGCGKSAVARAFADELDARGFDVAVVREPMPYGDLAEKRVERFADASDLDGLTVEEREEYADHVAAGHAVYAGVDYRAVFDRASDEADVLVWDGGNNELAFARPDHHLVLVDALRPEHGERYHPGEANLRRADAVLVTKENAASDAQIEAATDSAARLAPTDAPIHHADSVVRADDPDAIAGRDALVVEDGPTLTHGGTSHGAGYAAARDAGAASILDPEPHAVGQIADVFASYDHLDRVLPAMGYSEAQLADLEATIDAVDPDVVVAGTPVDLDAVVDVDAPVVRARYEIECRDATPASLLDAGLGGALDF
ncbi:GTPase [Halarchaeum nitratireducens]|uniref:GTPase n=1 Tax=Halarchaeum nitratireducens TaxID=489913 RepID=A0A830GC89_9EURY|nr:GTPase [Halarchaeum nitratireducens]GGN14751.1 GTPase [Halarchaeum nitratireducens]